ncbi:ANM_HP_G0212830.mRNA.1.CDS.1 [Saccharomyces cerevisiae]|nr:ANM_HP_G0212830.mRNA.1.CDS.1 [Saccharomyces cerevisiae]CAI6972700.1 ANM_HP_G0212830.mRNA.1.CDS.1 [Saccharomyces cerevisiae]
MSFDRQLTEDQRSSLTNLDTPFPSVKSEVPWMELIFSHNSSLLVHPAKKKKSSWFSKLQSSDHTQGLPAELKRHHSMKRARHKALAN